MFKIRLYIIIFIGFFSVTITAQEKLNEYLTIAANNNPGLKMAFNQYMAALEKAPQVSSLPDPQIAFGYFIQPIETRMGPQEFKFSATQMFPWFGTLKAKENAAIAQAKAKYERFEEEKSKLFQEVKANWYNLYFNLKATIISKANMAILKSFKQLANTKVEAGMASAVDLYQIQMEIYDLENQIALLIDNQFHLEVSFMNLLGSNESINFSIPDSLSTEDLLLSKEAVWDSIRIKNHQLIDLDLQMAALNYRKDVAQKAGAPDFSLGIDYSVIGKGDNNLSGNDAIMFPKVGLTIPLYRNKYKSMVQEVVYLETAKSFEKSNKINVLENIFEKTWNEYIDAQRRLSLYAKQVELAQKSLRMMETEYANTSTNFEELLRMERRQLKYQLELEKAAADNLASMAFIDYLMGN